MLSPQVIAQAGGNVGVKKVHNHYAELRFKPPDRPVQSRLLDAKEVIVGEQRDERAPDYFISADRVRATQYDYMVRIRQWDAPIECLRALVDSGMTIEGRSRPYYVGELTGEPIHVEVRAIDLLELNDGTVKMVRTVVPRCKLWSSYQTWHHLDKQGMVLIHDVRLRIVKSTVDIGGQPLEKVPDEGIFWYSDLGDWVPPKAKIYEVRELHDAPDGGDAISEDVLDEDDDSPDAISGPTIEPAGRGY